MFTYFSRYFLSSAVLLFGLVALAPAGLWAQESLPPEEEVPTVDRAKVQQLLEEFGVSRYPDFCAIESRCYQEEDSAQYYTHLRTYRYRAPVEEVWEAYRHIAPQRAWGCLLVDHVLSVNRATGRPNPSGTAYAGMEEGQMHFLQLNFLGMVRLAVGHEVTEVNPEARRMGFCYLEEGASAGSQWISMRRLPNGETEVSHLTRYYSGKSFRDRHLYPTLHSLIINAFHHNVKSSLRQKMRREARLRKAL